MTNLEKCIYLSKCYLANSEDPKKVGKISDKEIAPIFIKDSDIPWYRVGHNSTHQFYLGVDKDNKMYCYSYSMDWKCTLPDEEYERLVKDPNIDSWNKIYECGEWVDKISIVPLLDEDAYIGHW